jgi:hypothetical protein
MQGSIIIDELDVCDEIIFCQKGEVYLGYEINKQKKYCIKYLSGCIIGAFGCTFNQRSIYVAYANSNCDCSFIRKTNWQKILS